MRIQLPTDCDELQKLQKEYNEAEESTKRLYKRLAQLRSVRDELVKQLYQKFQNDIDSLSTTAFQQERKSEELFKKLRSFFSKDGKTHAQLFEQHTGIRVGDVFKFGRGKKTHVAIYDAKSNYFSIYENTPNKKEATYKFHRLGFFDDDICYNLKEIFKRCKKIFAESENIS